MQGNDFLKKHRSEILLCLTILALITRLWNLNFVNKVIFDEVHYGRYISHYLQRQYFFDDHPPLAKLIIAGLAKISQLNPKTNVEHIGLNYPQGTPVAVLRFITALFGALLIPLIFLFTERITRSSRAGFIASTALLFDNAFLVHSRFISPDTFLIFFIFFTIYAYLKSEGAKKIRWLILSGISAGFAVSTKWIGLTGPAVVFCLILYEERLKLFSRKIFLYFLVFIALPLLIYYAVISVHFRILQHAGGLKEFMGLNQSMFYSHSRPLTHGYSSKWFSWPIMARPVSYLHSSSGNKQIQNLTFLGNPLVWWLSSLGIFTFIVLILLRIISTSKFKFLPDLPGKGIIILGYFISYLPFMSISRCMFLYHYLPALIFAIMGTAVLLDRFLLPQDREIPSPLPSIITFIAGLSVIALISRAVFLWHLPKDIPFLIGALLIMLGSSFSIFLYFKIKNIYRIPHLWFWVLFLILLGGFFILLPLSYGLPIQQKTFDFLTWIRSWL